MTKQELNFYIKADHIMNSQWNNILIPPLKTL